MRVWVRYLLIGILTVLTVISAILPFLPAIFFIVLLAALFFNKSIGEVRREWRSIPKEARTIRKFYEILSQEREP